MLALCILKMNKPKHGEDYFLESFNVFLRDLIKLSRIKGGDKNTMGGVDRNTTFLSYCATTQVLCGF